MDKDIRKQINGVRDRLLEGIKLEQKYVDAGDEVHALMIRAGNISDRNMIALLHKGLDLSSPGAMDQFAMDALRFKMKAQPIRRKCTKCEKTLDRARDERGALYFFCSCGYDSRKKWIFTECCG